MSRKPLYFTFNNICSLDVKDLYIVNTLPMPNSPNRRVTKTQVSGRSGNLRIIETDDFGQDVYDDIDKSLTLCYKGDDIDFIKRWLRGRGNLILSNQPDRYFKASIDNILSIEKIIRTMNNFTIIFSCFPYAYLNTGDIPIIYTPTENTWETIIMNEYDLSLPHLKIYGQGDIGVMVNGVETDFYSVDGYIECDSELQQCYKGNQNLGMNMSGNFPALYEKENIIEFTGNISKIELTPHWRNI
ncbi:Phage-related protein [Clostridium acidisoli DSM 12555]|uniref:Phage-related protein n=1 Tax=Clostridium acidisoli DSM 12555 TaxID=1121291 RepID=A0A1W1X5U6_9CLOT|nr:hypothetical protein [Clostridium acidisoli]SMC19296.1 Phage-related protein [Clostridium acidisoli DSM 12555]